MSRTYELWDTTTRNLVAAYDSESEALSFVRQCVTDQGAASLTSWVLLWDDDEADDAGQVAEGHALLIRAAAFVDSLPGVIERRAG
jgi:hypothetical protein